MLEEIHRRVGKRVQKPLLHSAVPLDGRNFAIRSQETNLGNMLADAVRAFYDTEVGFFNGGGVRSDLILKATVPDGEPLLVRDIISKPDHLSHLIKTDKITTKDICPFGNSLVVKRLTGEAIRLALENSVSDKHTDGRFLQISGLRMVASWQRPEGSRVVDIFLEKPDGRFEPLELARTYTVTMPGFIAQGFDGFSWFPQMETIVGEEAAMTDSGLLLAMLGHSEELAEGGSDHNAHATGIERARTLTIVGQNPSDFLPIVSPVVEDRIKFVGL